MPGLQVLYARHAPNELFQALTGQAAKRICANVTSHLQAPRRIPIIWIYRVTAGEFDEGELFDARALIPHVLLDRIGATVYLLDDLAFGPVTGLRLVDQIAADVPKIRVAAFYCEQPFAPL